CRRRHTSFSRDWSSDVCSSDLLTRRGYADARAEPRRVVVDHATFTVQPTYNIASGPLVRLDGVRLETRGRTNPDWVAGLAPWTRSEEHTSELQSRENLVCRLLL